MSYRTQYPSESPPSYDSHFFPPNNSQNPPPTHPTPQVGYFEHQRHAVHAPRMSDETKQKLQCFLIGAALAAITAVACYYCFTRGFSMIDGAYSNLQLFGGYSLIYMGLTFSLVSVVNVLYTGCKIACSDSSFEYTRNEKKIQICGTLFAPIAMIPVAFYCALAVMVNRR